MQVVDASSVELWSIDEVAEKLRVSAKTVARLCASRDLESVKIGTRRLVPPAAVAAYIAGLRTDGSDAPDAA